jgi:hypothetical protein
LYKALDKQEKPTTLNVETFYSKTNSAASPDIDIDIEDPTDDVQPAKITHIEYSKSDVFSTSWNTTSPIDLTDKRIAIDFRLSHYENARLPMLRTLQFVEGAFADSAIESAEFSQDSQLEITPGWLFANRRNLRAVVLPPFIISIGERAFRSGIDDGLLAQIFTSCNIQHIGK